MARRSATPPPRTGAGLVMVCAWFAAACDVPTSPPEWETTWVVPGETVTIGVGSLLPDPLTVAGDRSAFLLDLDPTGVDRTLGEVCDACRPLDGTTAAKPAFSATFGSATDLPADVVSASVASGTVEIRITNGFNFDPVRPGGGATGTIVVVVTNGGRVIATDTIDGATEGFPAGSVRTLVLDFAPGVVAGSIAVDVSIDSPAGDPVPIDIDQVIDVTATPGDVRLTQAEVAVADRVVEVEAAELDLEGVDDEVRDRIHGGAFRLAIANPFAVEGIVELTFATPAATFEKAVALAQGESAPRVAFTRDELRALAGRVVTFGGTGTVTAPSGTVTVTPSQTVTIDAELELVLGPKEE
ncbi:MAG TPA: hypothetical protein VF158_04000 [Longimicrobiales bacterium]